MKLSLLSKDKGLFCLLIFLISLMPIQNQVLARSDARTDQERLLTDILSEFEEVYKVFFNFKSSLVRDKKVHFDFKEGEIFEAAVNRLLLNTGLEYEIINDRFILLFEDSKKGKRSSKKIRRKIEQIEKLEKEGGISIKRNSSNPKERLTTILRSPALTQKPIKVSGTVVDGLGEPLIGVNVFIKGTSTGTITEIDGSYSIDVPDAQSVLVFSYTGYLTQEIEVGNQTAINIVLEENVEQLDEVVVIGYGAQKKSDITGAVSSVKAEDLVAFPALDATQALQGRAAGVQISSTNGAPGSNTRIRVRGGTSISANSDPLIVVDGLIGAIFPPPEDIASVEVLKDASSTAIYGSRGANGVILVTTKQGSKGVPKINFSASYTIQEEINRVDLLNREQYIAYNTELFGTYSPYSNGDGSNFSTDWQDEVFRTGGIQNYNLSVAGGSDKTKYYLSGAIFDQEGIIENSGFARYSLTANIDSKLSDRVSIGTNLLFRNSKTNGVSTQEVTAGATNGVITSAWLFGPDRPIQDPNGSFTRSGFGTNFDNAFATATQRDNERLEDLFQGNAYLNVNLIDGLNFKASFGYISSSQREGTFFPTTLVRGQIDNGFGQVSNFMRRTLLTEHYLNFNKEIGSGQLDAVLGYSYQVNENEFYRSDATEFQGNGLSFYGIGGAANPANIVNSYSNNKIESWYGRLNYSLKNKYLFTFTGRTDGASVLAEGNQWDFFPSAAFGWRFLEESFMSGIQEVISNGKLRVSYGITGNQSVPPFSSLNTFSNNVRTVINGQQVTTVAIQQLGNDELKWESTKQFNLGLDLGFLDGRIGLEADYYIMNTEDLLFAIPVPIETGSVASSIFTNIGEVENKGFELSINTKPIVGEFSWDLAFNISRNVNKIISLPDGEDIFLQNGPGGVLSSSIGILREGQPVGVFFGYQFVGINDGTNPNTFEFDEEDNPLPGGVVYADVEGLDEDGNLTGIGDGVLNIDDQTIIGDPNPDFIWGLNNTFTYKGFSLNIFIQSQVGGDVYNITRLQSDQVNTGLNATTDILNRYTLTNTNTDVPVLSSTRQVLSSSRFVEDGSFVRLRNISLGYNLPQSITDKLKLSSARVYVSGQNLITITDYSGFDPEVSYDVGTARNSNIRQGLDYGSFPITKGYTVGLNIGF